MIPQENVAHRFVEIPGCDRPTRGTLTIPPNTTGVVVFAHGSGSGRASPRNQFVARSLQEAGIATLMFDLLEDAEVADKRKVFDIPLLADRLLNAAEWLSTEADTKSLRIGLFGASTGAGAALMVAGREPQRFAAIVSRGGRPDLAGHFLSSVRAPTLLIVGGNDVFVVDLNKQSLSQLRCPKELVIIPGASHLFAETGALEEVARLAKDWFLEHFAPMKAKAWL
jgi:putative phosphoribosyl transferase